MGSQWRAIKIGVTWDLPEDMSHFSENIAGVKLSYHPTFQADFVNMGTR